MVRSMRMVYDLHGIFVDVVSLETLQFPELDDLNVGACSQGALTAEQLALFSNRSSVPVGGIVIYFTRTTTPLPLNGCAAHVAGAPSAVITQFASRWSLAHEVGHVLGLNHVDGTNRLMTRSGTFSIGNAVPILTNPEANSIRSSPFIKPF
jgi:hypothetical protein